MIRKKAGSSLIGEMFKHKQNKEFLRLIVFRKNNVNTYLEVDKDNIPIIKKRPWSARLAMQTKIVTGFDDLLFIKKI